MESIFINALLTNKKNPPKTLTYCVIMITAISYRNTGSFTVTKVKQCRAWSVSRWMTV